MSPSPAPRQHHLSSQGQTPLPQEREGRSPAPQTLQGANGSSGCLENSGKICLCHGSEPFLWLLLQNKQWVFKNTSLYIEAGWIREDPFWGRAGVREEGSEQLLAPGAPASPGAWRGNGRSWPQAAAEGLSICPGAGGVRWLRRQQLWSSSPRVLSSSSSWGVFHFQQPSTAAKCLHGPKSPPKPRPAPSQPTQGEESLGLSAWQC